MMAVTMCVLLGTLPCGAFGGAGYKGREVLETSVTSLGRELCPLQIPWCFLYIVQGLKKT